MAHALYRQPYRRPHRPCHACRADAGRGSAAHTRGEKRTMPVRLHAERRLLHAPVSSCPCSRPEGREMPARIRTQRQRLLRSPRALTQVATAATNEPSAAVTCPTEVCYLSVGARETCLCSNRGETYVCNGCWRLPLCRTSRHQIRCARCYRRSIACGGVHR